MTSNDHDAAIRARALVRDFDDQHAVAGVDLEVGRGEVYGFLGPNGAGKSTTVRMLCTLLSPTSGEASVAGFDVVKHPGQVRLRIGVALQDVALDPKQTGLVVAPGAVFDISIESAGSLAGGNLDSMKKLTLSTGGVTLQSKGTPAVKLTRLRVNRGGTVTLEAFELLGGVKDAADIEQLGRMLGTMIGLGAAGVPDRAALDAAAGTNPKAELVEGLTKGMIEKQFTAAVQKLIRDNAAAIPGVDLLKATGVQP